MQYELTVLRQLYRWLVAKGDITTNPTTTLRLKRAPRPLPTLLDVDVLSQLLDQPMPDDAEAGRLWLRDKAMLELLYGSGLRVGELVGLNISDIDHSQRLLRVLGKGNKTRIVPFGRKAKDAVMQWLQIYPLWQGDFVPDAALFITQKGEPLKARQIENRVKFQAQRAGVNVDLHPHLLRHCFASHMLSNSGDIRAVQEMLGHSNLSTTQIYTHVDFDQLARVYDQAHPRASKK